jgi:hypothetical protein
MNTREILLRANRDRARVKFTIGGESVVGRPAIVGESVVLMVTDGNAFPSRAVFIAAITAVEVIA